MRIITIAFVCLIWFTLTTAMASPRLGLRPDGICTRDINLWGNASQCSCKEGDIYDERAGLCLENREGESIMLQGAVSSGIAAIGGETTGFEIKTRENVIYELILKLDDQEKLDKLSGQWFEVIGELITIQSVERTERKAVIVEDLSVLE